MTYWLLETDTDVLAAEVRKRIDHYADRMETSGRAEIWARMSRLDYGRDLDTNLRAGRVTSGGAQGEMIGTRDNRLGRLNRSTSTLIVGARPTFTTRSISDGSASIQKVNVGDKLCDFMISKKGAERANKRAQRFMQLYGMGWVAVTWNERAGKLVGRELLDKEGRPIFYTDEEGNTVPMTLGPKDEVPEGYLARDRYEGDICFAPKRPDEVVYDVDLDETSQHEWLLVMRQVNRYKLAQQYPEQEEHILNSDTRTRLEEIRQSLKLEGEVTRRRVNGDMVTVYDLIVPPSCLVPEGVFGTYLADKMVAVDRAMYDDFAHYEMTAEYEPGTKHGYSSQWDLCGPQQCNDAANVAITTNVENSGKQVLFIPTGSDLDTSKEALATPYTVVRGELPPQFMTQDASGITQQLQAKEMYIDGMTQIAGTNSTMLGDVSASQSGEALKTMSALAQQSVSETQEAYADAFGASMYGGLKRYRTFASDKTLARIMGAGHAADIKTFRSELGTIEDIDTEMGPAALRFSAGKADFASRMWDAGAIKDPNQYLEALATGKTTPILERPQSQRKLIEQENEALRAGQKAYVHDTDDHRLHILGHSCVGDDMQLRIPETGPDGVPVLEPVMGPDGLPVLGPDGMPAMAPKLNPVLTVSRDHIMEHVRALVEMNPDLASALMTEPVPGQIIMQQMQAQMPPPAPPVPGDVPPPAEGAGNVNPAPMPEV